MTIFAYPTTPFAHYLGIFVLNLGFTSHRSLLRSQGTIFRLGCMQIELRNVMHKHDDKDPNPIYVSVLTASMVM